MAAQTSRPRLDQSTHLSQNATKIQHLRNNTKAALGCFGEDQFQPGGALPLPLPLLPTPHPALLLCQMLPRPVAHLLQKAEPRCW